MAVDFSALTRKKVGEAKRPPALPMGNYSGIITKYEFGEKNRKGVLSPIVRYTLKLSGPADDSIEPSELEGFDLSARQVRADFYLGDDIDYILAGFLKSAGQEEGVEFEEAIPAVVGMEVVVEVQQYLNNRTNETENQVGSLRGA